MTARKPDAIFSPPPYILVQDGADPPKSQLPKDINPSNFIRVSRPGFVSGVWVIDPEMEISRDFFGKDVSVGLDEERKNLDIRTTAKGEIKAHVFVKHKSQGLPDIEKEVKRTTVYVETLDGRISLKVHDESPATNSNDRHPIIIDATANMGRLRVYLPRSFCGPLCVVTPQPVEYSDAIKRRLTPFSELDGTHHAFLGDFDTARWGGWEAWTGDALKACTAVEGVGIYFDDEVSIPTSGDLGGCVVA